LAATAFPPPIQSGGGVSQAWNEDSADPLAARSLLVHRDSRKVVGAMSSRIFSDVSAADAFCRERLLPELMRLKAKVERRDAAHAVTGYLLQHPTGGEMHLEVRTAKAPTTTRSFSCSESEQAVSAYKEFGDSPPSVRLVVEFCA